MTGPPTSKGSGGADLASVLAALDEERRAAEGAADRHVGRAHKRGILTLVMVFLLVGGVIQLFTATPDTRAPAAGGSRASVVFSNAGTGTCLSWPPDAPDKPSFVQCRSDHMFEVAKPVGMNNFGDPCQLGVGGVGHPGLALAVIAEAPRLQHGGGAHALAARRRCRPGRRRRRRRPWGAP